MANLDRTTLLESFVSNFTSSHTKNENDHLLACWRIQDCGHCVVSSHSCGWCPYSATCVPLPRGGNLLSPIRHEHICPMPWQERWELRTAPFGCNCSTTTFLAALITCLSTLVSLFVLWVLFKMLKLVWAAWRGGSGGWKIDVIEVPEGERWDQGIWVRKGDGLFDPLRNHWKRMGQTEQEAGRDPEVLVVDGERRPLLANI